MINLKVPDWWDSIRAIIAIILVGSFAIAVHNKDLSVERIELLKEVALYAVVFYFTLKKRKEGNGA